MQWCHLPQRSDLEFQVDQEDQGVRGHWQLQSKTKAGYWFGLWTPQVEYVSSRKVQTLAWDQLHSRGTTFYSQRLQAIFHLLFCPPGCRLPEIQIQNISTWEKPLTVIGPICSSSGKWGRCWSWRSRWSWRTWTPIVTNPWWSCWPLGSGRARYWISLWTLTWKRKIQIKNLEHQIF